MNADQLKQAAEPIAVAIARNCGVAPQLVFPHLYLGLTDLFAALPSSAEPTLFQVQRIDGSPLAQWEQCSREYYEATLATGRYGGFDDGPASEARALCVCSSAPKAAPAPVTTEVQAALRTLNVLGYTYHGGTAWKPPLGSATVAEDAARWRVVASNVHYVSGTDDVMIIQMSLGAKPENFLQRYLDHKIADFAARAQQEGGA